MKRIGLSSGGTIPQPEDDHILSKSSLGLRVTPKGELRLDDIVDGPEISASIALALRKAFDAGGNEGLLHLGVVLAGSLLPPDLRFASLFAQEYAVLALHSTGGVLGAELAPELPVPESERWLARLPPMPGAEYVSPLTIRRWWEGIGEALRAAVLRTGVSLAEWLPSQSGTWTRVGRVHLHLAENKANPARPFAYLATYTTRVGAGARPQHVPLVRALEEFAGNGKKSALLALLKPLSEAASKLPWLAEMVESGAVFRTVGLEAAEAHRFLVSIPRLEESGLLCSVPDWWSAARRPRVQVAVRLGTKSPAGLGTDAIVDFDASLAIGNETLSRSEWDAILQAGGEFVQVRGKWVEVDREKLKELLAGWKEAGRSGVTLAEGLRMLAGLGGPSERGEAAAPGPDTPAWASVAAGTWLKETLETLRHPESATDAPRGGGLTATLRPYQLVGVRWLAFLERLALGACLADDMGLGKTIQVLALLSRLRREKRGPHLLVAPASLLSNWKAEAARFAPELVLFLAHASATPKGELEKVDEKRLRGIDLVVTTYGSIARFAWIGRTKWDLVILDEAQSIKNPGAAQTRAVKSLPSKSRIALTGTPVENRLGDLWSIFDFLNPGLLGGAAAFQKALKRMDGEPSGYAPLRQLVAPYILRRLKTDPKVISDLPPKTELETHCLLTKKQAALYARVVEELTRSLETKDGMARRGLVLATLLRLKQICNHPAQWKGDGAWGADESGKFIRLAELAEEIASRQEKVLVFTQFREMTAPLAAHLEAVMGRGGLTLDGSTAVRSRGALVARFQEDDRIPFLVLSVKAGGTGLNLTAARHVIHFDRWWNPAVENQATDRAFRIGQKNPVLVHKFVCRGTVEERISEMIRAKESLAREVVGAGGGEALLTEMPNDELLRTVALDLESATSG